SDRGPAAPGRVGSHRSSGRHHRDSTRSSIETIAARGLIAVNRLRHPVQMRRSIMTPFDLTGRVAVITGGNGGIGLGMAQGFAAAGADVVVAARNAEKAEAALPALGAKGVFIAFNVAEEGSCRAMIEQAVGRFGRLDILVNNAGTSIRKPPEDYTAAEWHAVLDTNLTGALFCSQAAYPAMKQAGGGKIINIGSMFSIFGTSYGAAYAASKGALVQLTQSLAGAGPLVVLCHGFPESWYSWRHQLAALAEAGFHAVAPDMRGYGQTDRPEAIDQYTLLHLVGDMVGLLDVLGAEQAVIAGHDWGAPVAWNAARLRPDRIRGVIGLSVPFVPRGPVRPTTQMPQTDDAIW